MFYHYQCTEWPQQIWIKVSKFFLTFTNHSIRAHTQDAQNLYQLRTLSPFSDPNLLSKSTFKCEHCEKRFTSQKTIFGKSMKWVLKGGILNDADSGPLTMRTGMEILAWFLVGGNYYSHTWFLYTTGLFRYQGPPEKEKKAEHFFKGHRQGHSYTYWNFIIFLSCVDHFDIRIQPIEAIWASRPLRPKRPT